MLSIHAARIVSPLVVFSWWAGLDIVFAAAVTAEDPTCMTVVSVWMSGVDPLEAATAGFTSSLGRLSTSDWLLKNQSEIMIESGQTVGSNRRVRSSSQIQSLNAFLVMTDSRSCRRRRGLASKHESTSTDSSLIVVCSNVVSRAGCSQVVDAKKQTSFGLVSQQPLYLLKFSIYQERLVRDAR